MKIAVVGPNSEFGKRLVEELRLNHHEVSEWSRFPNESLGKSVYFNIEEPFSGSTENLDVVFVLAWKQFPRNYTTFKQNSSAIGALIENAHHNNVRVIFISTLGAVNFSKSQHVKGKRAIEEMLRAGDTIIRPASITTITGSLSGNVSWIEKLSIPVEIKFKPELYLAKVNIQKVVDTCVNQLSNLNELALITLIDEVVHLQLGDRKRSLLKIVISQKLATKFFEYLKKIPIERLRDIADKWQALEATQNFLYKYKENHL